MLQVDRVADIATEDKGDKNHLQEIKAADWCILKLCLFITKDNNNNNNVFEGEGGRIRM